MREPIDFSEGYESRRDGEEAPAKGRGFQLDRTSNKLVYLATGVEDFAAEYDEPSVFDVIIERAYSLKSKKDAREFVETAVLIMVMVLKLPRTRNSETFARAWILDTLDKRVDINTTDPYNDRWFDHVLYPRLSHLSQHHPADFRKFQIAMGRFVSLPDLSSTNPTVYRKRAA